MSSKERIHSLPRYLPVPPGGASGVAGHHLFGIQIHTTEERYVPREPPDSMRFSWDVKKSLGNK